MRTAKAEIPAALMVRLPPDKVRQNRGPSQNSLALHRAALEGNPHAAMPTGRLQTVSEISVGLNSSEDTASKARCPESLLLYHFDIRQCPGLLE
jgi:hypothetical protein